MRVVELEPPDLPPLDGAEWVNLRPVVDPDHDPGEGDGLFGLFRGRGPAVPMGTWHRTDRLAGVLHGAGPKLARQLDVPEGWRVVQDHPRRGLVLAVPDGVPDAEVVHWLVAVGTTLCPVPTTGRWVAELHP